MKIYYQDTDITESVQVKSCIARDNGGGRSDSLTIEFNNASSWHSWGAQEDDQIAVAHNGYNTGVMYINRVIPENDVYTIMASSLPCKAREKGYRSFYKKSIEEIMRQCAMESNMDFSIYGIDGKIIIPYIERNNEGCAAFLDKLLTLEGAALKCVNGKYSAIGLAYAQERTALQMLQLTATQEGIHYMKKGTAYKGVKIITPYASGTATDDNVSENHTWYTICGELPARNNIQAARWARGKLLALNRQCEELIMQTDFNAGLTALIRIDVESNTDTAGQWLIQDVEHDFMNLKTTATMRRCIWSIN